MKTITSLLIVFFCLSIGYGQVGINNTDPNALLDIRSSNQANPSNQDGILIPKVNEFPTPNPTSQQNGMMVYATGSGAPERGFYVWDNTTTAWKTINGGLERIDEGSGGAGWRLAGADPSFHGNIGWRAKDFSYQFAASTRGATGYISTAFGVATIASANTSTAFGNYTVASGISSTTFGRFTTAPTFAQTTFGTFNTNFTGDASNFVDTDPLFVIGNGIDNLNKSDALSILKNGTITAPSLDISEITDNKALLTKEYADVNYTVETVETPSNAVLNTGWTNWSISYSPAGYYKHNNRVYLRGLLRNTNPIIGSGTVIFTLPTGYRPLKIKICTGMQNAGIRIDVHTNGQVIYLSGDSLFDEFISLEGISFDLN